MKVKELIEQLKKFDPDLMVVVDGYKGGVDEPQTPVEILIKLNKHEECFYGKHDFHHVTNEDKPDCAAVYLAR
jgi:hypothetical protein